MIKINLLPPEYQVENLFPIKKLGTMLFVVTMLIFAFLYFYGYLQRSRLQNELQQIKTTYCLLEESMKRKEAFEKNQVMLNKKNSILIDVSKERISWYAILVQLGTLSTEDIWLKEVKFNEKNEVVLEGTATSYTHLLEYLDKLSKHTLFMDPEIKNSSTSKNLEKFSDFEIVVKLKEM